MDGAPDQVNRPAASGCEGEVSAKAPISPRAISSNWLCMVGATPSRNCRSPASLPLAVVSPPLPAASGTLSI